MALRELFARFTFDFDQAKIDQITKVTQAAEAKVEGLAAAFAPAGAALGALVEPLDVMSSLMQETTEGFSRFGAEVGVEFGGAAEIMQETAAAEQAVALGAAQAAPKLDGMANGAKKAAQAGFNLKQAFGQALAAFGIFGGTLGAVFGGRAMAHAIENEIEMAAEFDPLARKTGMGAEALQALGAYAKHADVDFGVLTASLTALTKNVGLFAAGAPSRIKGVFKTLKIGVKDVKGMAPEDVFWKIGKGIASITDPTQKLAFSQRVFGESGGLMLEMFHGTAEEVEANKKLYTELGVVYSDTFVEKADAAEKKTELLGVQLHKIKVNLIAGLLPALMWGASKLTAFGVTVAKISERTRIFQGAFLSGGWMLFSKVLARLTTGGGGVVGMLKKIFPLIARMARVLLPWIAWTLILDDIMVFLRGGDSLIGRFLDSLFGAGAATEVLASLKEAIGLIITTVQDVVRAIHEWWAANTAAGEAIKDVFRGILAVVGGFIDAWLIMTGNASDKTIAAFMRLTQPIEDAVNGLSEFFRYLWKDITSGAAGAVDAIIAYIKEIPFKIGGKLWSFITGESAEDWRKKVGAPPPPNAPPPQLGDYPHGFVPFSAVPFGSFPMSTPVPAPAIAGASGAGGVVTINDNRSIDVTVPANASPAQTGRTVAAAVTAAQPPINLKALHGALAGAPNG